MSSVLGSALLGLGPRHGPGHCLGALHAQWQVTLLTTLPPWCVMPQLPLGDPGRPVSLRGRSMAHSGEEERMSIPQEGNSTHTLQLGFLQG